MSQFDFARLKNGRGGNAGSHQARFQKMSQWSSYIECIPDIVQLFGGSHAFRLKFVCTYRNADIPISLDSFTVNGIESDYPPNIRKAEVVPFKQFASKTS